MAATVTQSIRGSRKDMVTALNDFRLEENLFKASVSCLEEGLGIFTFARNPGRSADNFFDENELHHQYALF